MLPKFIVIGAPKAGSTYIQYLLRGHPAVVMPKPEEPYFEDPFYSHRTTEYFSQVFADAPPESICGIKCPTYLSSALCAQRIASDLPDAKLIVTLRDPVSRAISDYYHKMRFGLMPVVPLDIGMKKILSGEWDDANIQQVLEFGLYGRQIQQYREYFDASRFLILPESFSPEAHLKNMHEFAHFKDIEESD
jgi:hypothetical protein